MAVQPSKKYLLGDFQLEPGKRLLSMAGEPVHLASRPFQVLLHLIESRDRFVSRAELLDLFWQGKDVYELTLTKCVGAIRKSLNDSPDNPQFIVTRYSEGYRYIGPAEEQFGHGESSIIEVERTRGVTIVLEEEEEVHDAPTQDQQLATLLTSAATKRSDHRKRVPWMSAVAVGLAVALAAITVIVFRSRGSHAQGPSPIRSIAVLPLRNLTGDPSQEYLSDGVTESLITELARISGLKVISRGSVFAFKDKDADPREVGKRLGVMAVLEGSVRKSGDNVRVEVRLVSAEDGRVLWVGDSSNRALKDLLTVEDEIGCSVATELRVRMCGEGGTQKRDSNNVEAYQAYLKGRYFLNKRTPQGIAKGIEYFQRAIEIDPSYALAYTGLAFSYQNAMWFANSPPNEVREKARMAARRAIEIDATLAEAHIAMSAAYYDEWDLWKTFKESEAAIRLNPGSAEVHHAHAYSLIMLGRPDEAIAEITRALELDPLDVVMNVDAGEILLYARRYDEAIEALRDAIEMDPGRANAHSDLARAYEQKEMYAEAIAEYAQAETLAGADPETVASLKKAYAVSRMSGFWRRLLRLYEERSKQGYFPALSLAGTYARAGEKDRAFECLEKAYAERSPLLLEIKVCPEFDGLRSDARFTDLLRRAGVQD